MALPLLLVACLSGGSSGGGQPQACPPTVEIQGFAFQPALCTLKAGDSLVFKNLDSSPHTATSPAFDTGNLSQNQASQPVTLNTPGIFDYHCEIHSGMKGVIEVIQ
ncbi:cupredoxin domain-containing protein [Calidithermus terrae]|uniref:cupredoxin domain-containing protein n=1 Tax=Calidithermus terrae TaxID=1408545 RepID=UPI00147339E7|nr:cupredoxin domain-containing protein [Calidithermus terrae]